MSKSEHVANHQKASRLSKRGTITQSHKLLVKSPKPQNSTAKTGDLSSHKEKICEHKSIFILTAEFLIKHNAFSVIKQF